MASKRRGGLRSPELRGTLGTLLRTTTGAVRDALERGAREGRARLDDALSGRRRDAILAELGDLVLDLIRRGEIDLAELPEARDLVRQLDDLDDGATGVTGAIGATRDAPDRADPRPATRERFDDRSRRAPPRRPADRDDDGTVASGATAADLAAVRASRPILSARGKPAESPSTLAQTMPIKGFWRPATDPGAGGPAAASPPSPTRRPPLPHDPSRKGGISFDDDDDDLDDYMHPDDVPSRGAPGDDKA